MDTANQLLYQANKRRHTKQTLLERPFVGQVSAVNYRTEKFNVITPVVARSGDAALDYCHPFVGGSSWIRCSPEIGITPVIAYRSDRPQPTILRYQQENNEKRINKFYQKRNVYRPLRPGENEINSSGFAQSYYASRSIQENRGGLIRDWLNQDELESGHRAPLHVKQGMHHTVKKLGDEIREGVVKRWDAEGKIIFPKLKDNYAKEFFYDLKHFDGKNLIRKQEGQVLDDLGKVVNHSRTSKPLRVLHKYYHNDKFTSMELDELGNFSCVFPDSATEGGFLSFPKGGLQLTLGEEFKVTGKKGQSSLFKEDFFVEAGSAQLRLSKSGKVAMGSSSAELLDIVSQLLETLSQDTYKGFGAISDQATAGKYTKLLTDLNTIKGSL